MANFDLYYPTLLQHEGGFVNDPLDGGGATNKGITLATYRRWKPGASVSDLRAISDFMVRKIYKEGYWDVLHLDAFGSQRLAEVVFDHGVNAGVSRSAKMLQYLLNGQGFNLSVDGVIGTRTLGALKRADTTLLYNAFVQLRVKYYRFRAAQLRSSDTDTLFFSKSLHISPALSQQKFLKGWHKRATSFPMLASYGGLLLFSAFLLWQFIKK